MRDGGDRLIRQRVRSFSNFSCIPGGYRRLEIGLVEEGVLSMIVYMYDV